MGIAKTMMLPLCIVAIIFVGLTMVQIVEPIAKKQQFDQECREIALTAEARGGLELSDRIRAKETLEKLGAKDIVIEGPEKGSLMYGDIFNIIVKAKYPMKLGAPGFEFSEEEVDFAFKRTLFCRKVYLYDEVEE